MRMLNTRNEYSTKDIKMNVEVLGLDYRYLKEEEC